MNVNRMSNEWERPGNPNFEDSKEFNVWVVGCDEWFMHGLLCNVVLKTPSVWETFITCSICLSAGSFG